jgi:phosphoesterase RecJ-like protein
MSINWDRFASVIEQHQNILLTSHIRPDCDALGSELGMAGVLEKLGKSVRIVNGEVTPENLAFIDPSRRLLALGVDTQSDELDDVDLLMVLDTSAWAQLGPMADVVRTTRAKRIIVDHHLGEDDLGAELFKDPTAEATGRLVVDAAERLNVSLTAEIALPLFAAIATDTGWYRYGALTGDTYRSAGKLLDAGANPAAIYTELYERDTVGRVRLRGLILSRTQVELDGRLAHTYVRKPDFEQTGSNPSDTEDVINLTLGIAGTEAAVILVEQLTGGFKLSFRSRCELDCSEVAREFGGGGHKAAAGAFIDDPFEQAQRRVLDAVRARMTA